MSRRVIWQQCYDHTFGPVHIPWPINRDYSWTLHACVSLIEDGGAFLLEVSVNGITKDINLANVCVPIPVGPISLQICIANLQVAGGNVAFDLVGKACIDVSIGPIHVNQCVTLISQHISVHLLTQQHFAAFALPDRSDVPLYAYVVTPLSDKDITNALAQPALKA